MSAHDLTRRAFISIAAMAGLIATTGCPARNPKVVKVFKRSGRGRHVSNAAKKHNANMLFATEAVALANPAHPGDGSVVVTVVISQARYSKLFPGNKKIADLRKVV